jgi:hypothetical protein
VKESQLTTGTNSTGVQKKPDKGQGLSRALKESNKRQLVYVNDGDDSDDDLPITAVAQGRMAPSKITHTTQHSQPPLFHANDDAQRVKKTSNVNNASQLSLQNSLKDFDNQPLGIDTGRRDSAMNLNGSCQQTATELEKRQTPVEDFIYDDDANHVDGGLIGSGNDMLPSKQTPQPQSMSNSIGNVPGMEGFNHSRRSSQAPLDLARFSGSTHRPGPTPLPTAPRSENVQNSDDCMMDDEISSPLVLSKITMGLNTQNLKDFDVSIQAKLVEWMVTTRLDMGLYSILTLTL